MAEKLPYFAKRLLAIFVAFVIGWFAYMIAMMMTCYDGVLSMIFQPIMEAIASSLFVGGGLLAGLLLRIPIIGKLWRSSWLWASGIALVSLLLMCFGSSLGMTEQFTDQETGRHWTGLHSGVGLTCYFTLLFALSNWPIKKSASICG